MPVTVDTERFAKNIRILEQKLPAEATAMIRRVGHAAAVAMVSASPTDTRRYVRGWAIANNEAGLPPIAVPPVGPSKYVGQNRQRLEYQIRQAERQLAKRDRRVDFLRGRLRAWYDSTGRKPDKWYRAQMREIRKLETQEARFIKVVESARRELQFLTDDAILIGGRKREKGKDLGRSNLARVRNDVYGGSGRVSVSSGIAKVTLRNREPHASVLEPQFGIKGKGDAAAAAEVARINAEQARRNQSAA